MIYSAENYYFQNNKDFPFQKAVLLTAETVAIWSDRYEAKIINPNKAIKEKTKSDEFPNDMDEKKVITKDLLKWIWENSQVTDIFYLMFYKKETIEPTLFDHHDDSCCWVLNLSEIQFKELQQVWLKNGLAKDLFYDQNKSVVTIPNYYEKWSKLRRILFGGTYSFSPKVWEMMKKNDQDKNYIIQKQNNSV